MTIESSIRRRELGRRLQLAQNSAGFTGYELAAKMDWVPSTLSRTITGLRVASDVEIASMIGLCGIAGATRTRMLELCRPHRDMALHLSGDEQWQTYLIHAHDATRLLEFQPHIVPWMIQTPDYARALLGGEGSTASDAEFAARREAVSLLRLPNVEVLVHEWALRTPLCDSATMSDQLHHLLRMSVRDGLSLRVIPIGQGVAGSRHGAFTLLDVPLGPPVLYREDHVVGVLSDHKPHVAAYRRVWAALCAVALDEQTSRELIAKIVVDLYDSAGDNWRPVESWSIEG